MDTKSTQTHSPEFEFWMLRNPSFPQPNIIPADQLFLDGVILPLHLLSTQTKPNPDPVPEPNSSPAITDDGLTTTTSKRWKNIFMKKNNNNNTQEKVKKKEKRVRNSGDGGSAELNINIWPFSTGAPVTRKVNSAPCSRSNSAGDSKSRKWPSSPGRAGVHLGRSSPVWQVRHGGSTAKPTMSRRSRFASTGGGGGKAKVLNLSFPMCVGYSHNISYRIEDNSNSVSNGGGGSKLFNLRTFFTKKTFVTTH